MKHTSQPTDFGKVSLPVGQFVGQQTDAPYVAFRATFWSKLQNRLRQKSVRNFAYWNWWAENTCYKEIATPIWSHNRESPVLPEKLSTFYY